MARRRVKKKADTRTPLERAEAKAKAQANKAVEARRFAELTRALVAVGLPKPDTQLPFYGDKTARPWYFDMGYTLLRVAIEIHGGTRSWGRHSRGAGMATDREKMNQALAYGWRVLEFTGEQVDRDPMHCAELVSRVMTWRTVRPER